MGIRAGKALGNRLLFSRTPAQGTPRNDHPAIRQLQFRVPVGRGSQQLVGKRLQAAGNRNLPAKRAQAVAQQILQTRQGKLAQGRQGGGIAIAHPLPVKRRQFVEQGAGLAKMAGRLGKRRLSSRKALRQRHQRFVTQVIARQAGIPVAFIFDPGQPGLTGIGFDLAPRHTKQRPQQPPFAETPLGWHTGRPGDTGAAQQVEEHRLGLIAAVMGQQQDVTRHVGKNPVTRRAGSRLQTTATVALDNDPPQDKRHAETATVIGTKGSPRVGIGG